MVHCVRRPVTQRLLRELTGAGHHLLQRAAGLLLGFEKFMMRFGGLLLEGLKCGQPFVHEVKRVPEPGIIVGMGVFHWC